MTEISKFDRIVSRQYSGLVASLSVDHRRAALSITRGTTLLSRAFVDCNSKTPNAGGIETYRDNPSCVEELAANAMNVSVAFMEAVLSGLDPWIMDLEVNADPFRTMGFIEWLEGVDALAVRRFYTVAGASMEPKVAEIPNRSAVDAMVEAMVCMAEARNMKSKDFGSREVLGKYCPVMLDIAMRSEKLKDGGPGKGFKDIEIYGPNALVLCLLALSDLPTVTYVSSVRVDATARLKVPLNVDDAELIAIACARHSIKARRNRRGPLNKEFLNKVKEGGLAVRHIDQDPGFRGFFDDCYSGRRVYYRDAASAALVMSMEAEYKDLSERISNALGYVSPSRCTIVDTHSPKPTRSVSNPTRSVSNPTRSVSNRPITRLGDGSESVSSESEIGSLVGSREHQLDSEEISSRPKRRAEYTGPKKLTVTKRRAEYTGPKKLTVTERRTESTGPKKTKKDQVVEMFGVSNANKCMPESMFDPPVLDPSTVIPSDPGKYKSMIDSVLVPYISRNVERRLYKGFNIPTNKDQVMHYSKDGVARAVACVKRGVELRESSGDADLEKASDIVWKTIDGIKDAVKTTKGTRDTPVKDMWSNVHKSLGALSAILDVFIMKRVDRILHAVSMGTGLHLLDVVKKVIEEDDFVRDLHVTDRSVQRAKDIIQAHSDYAQEENTLGEVETEASLLVRKDAEYLISLMKDWAMTLWSVRSNRKSGFNGP